MHMKKIASLLFLLLAGHALQAQPGVPGIKILHSPDISTNGQVTFRLWAPKASEVLLAGDFISPVQARPEGVLPSRSVPMQKGEDGVWTLTTGSLAPEFYEYYYLVDGIRKLDPSNAFMARNGETWYNHFIVSLSEGDKGWMYQENPVRHGNVGKVWFESHALRTWRRLTVYTPAGYNAGDPNRDYPVLYLLHGAGNDEDSWKDLGRAIQILDNLIAAGKAEPMIVVMPDGNTTEEEPTLDEWFEDIVSFVEERYNVRKQRDARAIAGLSRGGKHTFLTTLRMPDTFGYIGLFSPAVAVPGMDPRKDRFGEELRKNALVREQIGTLSVSKPNLYWIGIGEDDYLYERVSDLREYFDETGFTYEYHQTEGNHTWRNWRSYLTGFLPRLFREESVQGARIAVFGGSFSVIPSSDIAKNFWSKTLGVQVDTYGIGGAGFSVRTGEERYIPGQIGKALSSGKHYDAFILWASTNDCANGVPTTEQDSMIRECVSRIRAAAPGSKIMLFTSLPEPLIENQKEIPSDLPPFVIRMRRQVAGIKAYAKAQERVCRELGIPCLNLYERSGIDLSNAHYFYGQDLLHMNDNGYDHIKELTAGFIQDNL